MKIFTPTEFSELIASIQEHSYRLPHEPESAPRRSHTLSVARPADDRFYLLGGSRIYDLVAIALKKKFPHLDDMEVEMFCKGVPGYLQRPCVMIEYIKDKEDRDYFIQKVLPPPEQQILDLSITRASNMGTILTTIEAVFVDYPDDMPYFLNVENAIKRLHASQRHQSNDVMKLLNAKNVRKIVYDFCVTLIKEAA